MSSNPYQAPESNLENNSVFKRSLWWKIYFYFIATLSAIGAVSQLTNPSAGIAEYIYVLLCIIGTVGFFGFVFLKPIYKPEFWLKLLVVYLAFSVLYYFITNIDQHMGMTDIQFYIATTISWLVSVPAYYAIYAYSKPNNPAWKNAA